MAIENLGRERAEVRLPLPAHLILADELDIGFVHQSGRIQRVPAALLPHEPRGQGADLVIDQRQEAIGRGGVPSFQLLEEPRGLRRIRIAHGSPAEEIRIGVRVFGPIVAQGPSPDKKLRRAPEAGARDSPNSLRMHLAFVAQTRAYHEAPTPKANP